MRVINEASGKVILMELSIADTFSKRFFGLMGRKQLKPGSGLKIEPCRSIHTFNMKFPIDVIFVSEEHKVLKMVNSMKPGKVSPTVKGARYVIEANADEFKDKIEVGDVIRTE